MMRMVICTSIFILAFAACAAEENVIARIGSHGIAAKELTCPPDLAHDRCQAYRQDKFERMTRALLIDAAAKMHDITIPDNIVERNAVQIPDHDVRRAETQYKMIARAVLSVRRGEDRDAIYRRDLESHGVTPEQFNSVLQTIPDVAAAERALRLNVAEESRRQTVDQARRRLIVEQLGRIVDANARNQGIPFDTAEQRFWSDLVSKTRTEVLDPSLKLPAMEGTLRP